MNPFACYSAINSKLSARSKIFLETKEWKHLLELKSVDDIIKYLKRHYGYQQHINASKAQDMHRGELEGLLNHYIVGEIESVLHYFSGEYKTFFKILLMQYEIMDLQLILRTITRSEELGYIRAHFIHSEKHACVDYAKLMGVQTVAQFVEVLRGTPYYEALGTMTQEDAIKREFHMEMKLYILYYKMLMKQAAKLNQKDYKAVQTIIGDRIDFANVQWIYRATKYYDIAPEEILVYSLPHGRRISYARLKKLCYAKSLEEFKTQAEGYLCCPIFKEDDDTTLECRMERCMYERLPDKKGESIVGVLNYIQELYIEIKDLVSVIEGVRYNISQEEVRKYLVHVL